MNYREQLTADIEATEREIRRVLVEMREEATHAFNKVDESLGRHLHHTSSNGSGRLVSRVAQC